MTLDAELVSVGTTAPEFLRMTDLGACLRGTPAPAIVTFCENFHPHEWSAFESGRYGVAVKLYSRSGVVALVFELTPAGGRLVFPLAYSLATIRAAGGDDALGQVVQSIDAYKAERGPDEGILVTFVFLSTDEPQLVRAMRAFTLPRMFGDRYIAAVERTIDQNLEAAADHVAGLSADGAAAWANALPGVAVAGHELELSDGEYVRFRRKQRSKGKA